MEGVPAPFTVVLQTCKIGAVEGSVGTTVGPLAFITLLITQHKRFHFHLHKSICNTKYSTTYDNMYFQKVIEHVCMNYTLMAGEEWELAVGLVAQ